MPVLFGAAAGSCRTTMPGRRREIAGVVAVAAGHAIDLQVRLLEIRPRLRLAAGRRPGIGHRAGAMRDPLVDRRAELRFRHAADADLLVRRIGDDDVDVVLHRLADARQIMHRRDAGLLQRVGGTDAGEEQQMRAVDRAAGQHDFAGRRRLDLAVAEILDALGAAVRDEDAGRERRGDERQVRPVEDWVEEGVGRAERARRP